MKPQDIIDRVSHSFKSVVPKASWGETSLFYNPGKALPNGVYFCTIKERDGEHDKASFLDREGVFRLAIGLGEKSYVSLFGAKPARPAKGQVIATRHDFTQLNQLMPHPIYGWMAWSQILNPTPSKFEELLPLIEEAYRIAVAKFDRKLGKESGTATLKE